MFTIVNLSAIDLNLLLVLDAVVAERSVAKAAKRLHVSSPAISNALSRLRGAIGDPIVTRSGRGIVPTPRALALAPAIARALREIEGAIDGGAFDARIAETQFTIAMADAGQLARLPKLAALLAKEMPRAKLRVVNVDTMVALGGLAGTEVDVAIGVSHPAPQVHRAPIYQEQTVLVARKGHPRLRDRASKVLLAGERHVEVHVAFGKPASVLAPSFASAGIAREIAAIVPTFTAAAAMVAASDLVAMLPASVVEALGPALGVRAILAPVRVPPIQMYMSWHRRTHTDPAMVRFRELVANAATR
jgi:DNA-binding transcriptional LysR family regulator